MKEKIAPFDFFEFLTTEEDVQMFVDACIEENKNDTDPACLADALAIAKEARERLAEKDKAVSAPLVQKAAFKNSPRPAQRGGSASSRL